MLTGSLRYARLSQQVASSIEAEIARGTWRGTLPGERHLAKSMQVSRRTIRAAMEILREWKIVETTHGAGSRILARQRSGARGNRWRAVGLLLPEDIDRLRPQTAIFIDRLRSLLYANGIRLEIHVSQRFFSSRPGAALTKLAAQFPHEAWVLAFSTRASQRWFQTRELPVLVVGTPHEGIELPYVDIDMHAVCRHASAHLLRKGHRSIALLIERSDNAGDRATEEGFLDGVRGFGRPDIQASVLRHEGTVESIRRQITRLQKGARPTALFICNPYHYLAVASILAEKGIAVPRDISLLCRDDDLFLSFLATEPSRYVCDSQVRAKMTFSVLVRILDGPGGTGDLHARMLPRFFEGASIAPPFSKSR